MKVQAILILSTLALADLSLGNDVGSHLDRDAVSSEAPEPVAGDRLYDRNHDRFNANLRSTSRRTLEVAVEEFQRDESIPSDMPLPTHETHSHRMMTECGDVNGHFKIDLTTDNFGHETSWKLQFLKGDVWTEVVSGPSSNSDFSGNTRYVGVQCLLPGKYKFTIFDKAKDGLCCAKGEGKYTAFVDGIMRFSSPLSSTTWAKRVHLFTISPRPASQPNQSQCSSSSDRKLKIVIKTDKYGGDTSWTVRDSQTGIIVAWSTKKYGANETDTSEMCLKSGGMYDFIVLDNNGDGMCCAHGNGYFKVHLEDNGLWKEIITGGDFKGKEFMQVIDLGWKAEDMSARDKEWLESHNHKRLVWQKFRHNKTFVPLTWDSSLEAESKVWAEHLLSSCGKGMWHDPNNNYGENVASNSGTGSWASRRTTDDIVARFVDREEEKLYPENLHLTQVLWRSTKYVGCGEASKEIENGGVCHTQVCRYARPGNCNLNKYMTNAKDWWLEPMLMDFTACGPACPPNGCH